MTRNLLCLSLAIFVLSCQSASLPKNDKTLRLNIHEPPSMDPRKGNDVTSHSLFKMCFEGLTRLGPDGEPVLALAKDVKISQDQKTFTFYLRDVFWSDGQPVTAYDFEETWRTILSPHFPSPFAYDLYLIKNAKAAKEGKGNIQEVGVKALDEKTLLVELEHSAPYFLSRVADPKYFAIPTHIDHIVPNWAENAGHNYVSNGPYLLKEWHHYDEIILEKNPTYWDKNSVKIETLSMAIIEDVNTELSMFENSQLDWAGSPLSVLPIDAIPALEKSHEVQKYAISGTYFYIFNTQKFPFTNAHIRRAFSLAINRQEIVENVTQGGQKPATSLIPPTIWKKEFSYFHDGDVEEAKREFALGLQELGISFHEFPPVALMYNTDQGHHKIAQAIQQQWQTAFGVHVHLENKEWKVYLDELSKGSYHVARMGGIADFSDPTSFLDQFKYSDFGYNFSGWTHPVFTNLLETADNTPDQTKRLQILQKAEALFIKEMPVAPIYFYTGNYLKKPWVKDVFLSDLSDIDFKWAYIQ